MRPETASVPTFRDVSPSASRLRSPRPVKLAGKTFTDVGRRRSAARVPRAIPRIRSGTIRGCASGRCFRRHLVHLHYDELALWLVEIGMPRDRIWSAQGFMAPSGGAMPLCRSPSTVPSRITIPAECPSQARSRRTAHLGVILYGAVRGERHSEWRTAARSSRRSPSIDPAVWRRRVQHRRFAQSAGVSRRTPPRIARSAICGTPARAISRRWRGTAAMASTPARPST